MHTLETLKDKSPADLNVICAELCGWKVHPKDKWLVIPPNSPYSVQPLHTLPPYTTSYDAIMPEVKKLSNYDHCTFRQWVNALTWKDGMNRQEHERAQTEASEADLTRALILVKQTS